MHGVLGMGRLAFASETLEESRAHVETLTCWETPSRIAADDL